MVSLVNGIVFQHIAAFVEPVLHLLENLNAVHDISLYFLLLLDVVAFVYSEEGAILADPPLASDTAELLQFLMLFTHPEQLHRVLFLFLRRCFGVRSLSAQSGRLVAILSLIQLKFLQAGIEVEFYGRARFRLGFLLPLSIGVEVLQRERLL